MLEVREIKCRSILSKCKIYSVDYSINPYLGCEHACKYCFARYMAKYAGKKSEEWGSFVHVKVNAPEVLKKELSGAKRGVVLLSSVCDPYQPLEKKYMLTRKILRVLANHDFPLTILTKSPLVLRDLDILKNFSDVEVGFTIVTLDERARSIFEPRAPSIKSRIEALAELKKERIQTYAMLGPFLPFISERDLEELIRILSRIKVDYLLVDRLNLKAGNWKSIKEAIMVYNPELVSEYRRILFDPTFYKEYYTSIKVRIKQLCDSRKLDVEFCF